MHRSRRRRSARPDGCRGGCEPIMQASNRATGERDHVDIPSIRRRLDRPKVEARPKDAFVFALGDGNERWDNETAVRFGDILERVEHGTLPSQICIITCPDLHDREQPSIDTHFVHDSAARSGSMMHDPRHGTGLGHRAGERPCDVRWKRTPRPTKQGVHVRVDQPRRHSRPRRMHERVTGTSWRSDRAAVHRPTLRKPGASARRRDDALEGVTECGRGAHRTRSMRACGSARFVFVRRTAPWSAIVSSRGTQSSTDGTRSASGRNVLERATSFRPSHQLHFVSSRVGPQT
jgi:hypothetical protein